MNSTNPTRILGWTTSSRRSLAWIALMIIAGIWFASDGAHPSEPPKAPVLWVDANTAPMGVLTALPRIGPVLAGRIVAARRESPLRSIGDLSARVRGVGPVTATAITPFLRFGPEALDKSDPVSRP
jgi:competence protein ComEA